MPEHYGWELREDGNIELNLLTGWSMVAFPNNIYGLQILHITDPAQSTDDPDKLQLALSETQLRELIEDLQNILETPHMGAPPTDSRH